MSRRSEYEWDAFDVPYMQSGAADTRAAVDDSHSTHAFLYVPDLSSRTGWSSHAVPAKEPPRSDRRVGFRR